MRAFGLHAIDAITISHARTQVSTSGSGASFSPTLPPPSSNDISDLSYLYMDTAATADQKPTYRFTVPTGLLFNQGNQDSQKWYLTLANMNSQLTWDTQSYSIRATCMLAEQVKMKGDEERTMRGNVCIKPTNLNTTRFSSCSFPAPGPRRSCGSATHPGLLQTGGAMRLEGSALCR